jgi:2,3-bisphosphoglycerate-independent phosphoglycerate mutase
MNKKVVLIILDGWGIATDKKVSAVDAAHTPFMDSLFAQYTHTKLSASGTDVGLPAGQMGNSEVGHLNLGSGRVVVQTLDKINRAVAEMSIKDNTTLQKALQHAKTHQKPVHFMGLVSDGGVHSHIEHLKALCTVAQEAGTKFFVHAFTDGRDTSPTSGLGFLNDLSAHLRTTPNGKIASVAGRYYAMDRDKRWERVALAYQCLVNAQGEKATSAQQAVQQSYDKKVTDEFILPTVITENGQPIATIQPDDVVICFNFRTDRCREITEALTQRDFPEQNMKTLPLYYVTMTRYDATFKDVKVMYEDEDVKNTLGEVVSKAGKKQLRIAETEKYPHVTFFFSGGKETQFEGESRIMCPSPKVATYDLKPEMSAFEIRDKIVAELKKKEVDFVCLNYANPDMVGHTGVFAAVVSACEAVDKCLQDTVETAKANGYTCLIIADHGNAEYMQNPDGSPHTAHTTNLVPCILVDDLLKSQALKVGKLADIAPTILELMGIPKPNDMTGESLLVGA